MNDQSFRITVFFYWNEKCVTLQTYGSEAQQRGHFWSLLFFFQRTCALLPQFPISASFFLLSEVSIQNEHIFAKCGCRTVKKWTGAHQCLPLCGQKEHTCQALWGKVAQRWKTQEGWRNWQDWEQYQAVVLTIVIVEHYYGNYKSETAQEEKRP